MSGPTAQRPAVMNGWLVTHLVPPLALLAIAAPSVALANPGEPEPAAKAGAQQAGSDGGADNKAEAKADPVDLDDFDDEGELAEIDGGALANAPPQNPGWMELVGYFHSAAVHLPIGWLLLMVLLDIAYLGLGRGELGAWGHRMLGLTALAFVPGIASGLMRYSTLGLSGEEAAHAHFHRNLVFGAFAAVIVAWIIRQLTRSRLRGASLVLYVVVMAAGVLMLLVAAHEGGEMVFGDPPSLSSAE